MDCINRCFEKDLGQLKFCRPPTYMLVFYEAARIKCSECNLILKNCDAFKKHRCMQQEDKDDDENLNDMLR